MGFMLPTDTSAVTKADLRHLTNQLLDAAQKLLRRCVDADVTFVRSTPTR